jgi:flagellar motor protein MotB
MALMMSFFVMVAAFSTQDKVKMQIVAGSMREAFGVQTVRTTASSSRTACRRGRR